MNFLNMLNHSYKVEYKTKPNLSRLGYLSVHVFDFTTYDSEIDELFAEKALEVCLAITSGKTFEYQKESDDNYRWYLIMCNMPFFVDKLEWGTSIRGAWWDLHGNDHFEINSCGLYCEHEQILNIKFNNEQWEKFVFAMDKFAHNK